MYQALHLLESSSPSYTDSADLVVRKQRDLLAERFKEDFRRIVREGPTAKLGAATTLLSTGRRRWNTIGRELAPELVELTKNKDAKIRQEAARCLGKVVPDPKIAVPALRAMLVSGPAPERRAAAEALNDLVRGASEVITYTGWQQPSDVSGFVQTASAVMPVAGSVLEDTDNQVRKSAVTALISAAEIAATAVPGRQADNRFGNEDDPEREFQNVRKALWPLVEELDKQITKLIPILKDKDREGVVAVDRALEAMAEARLWLLQRASNGESARQPNNEKRFANPFQSLRTAAAPLAEQLSDQDVRIRLAALYALETVETVGAPAAQAVIKSLKDADPFVRWAAVRALGKMAPETDKAVPALAGLLNDPNGDVQLTALAALARFGSAAKAAVPALREAIQRKDAAWRMQVINVLGSIGKDASPAIPELVKSLSAAEPEVRAAAARTLGKIDPRSAAAEEALRKALQDPDSDVRQAASEALLNMK
jgi:HEAT repeat protein